MPGQENSIYILPTMGMAVYASEATRVTDAMFIVAAKAVAGQVTDQDLATRLIYSQQSQILNASVHVADRIPTPHNIGALIWARAYRPVYPE